MISVKIFFTFKKYNSLLRQNYFNHLKKILQRACHFTNWIFRPNVDLILVNIESQSEATVV